ncbi:hypothetical protein [Klebsiella phage vB_KpnP_cmc355D]|uniref:Uncharacterized protein n=1 Tax=Klebsiella phage vB_KpnP_cmc355D TaxID=3110534 RepID=A0ABZ0ZY88_9CAUD|nr:hypothetical protein [Klebsiella phage vB_KpnP_cmc355D]
MIPTVNVIAINSWLLKVSASHSYLDSNTLAPLSSHTDNH